VKFSSWWSTTQPDNPLSDGGGGVNFPTTMVYPVF